jgi:citrate synthase
MLELFHPGLAGIIAGETEICDRDGDLRYRGYSVYDLAGGATYLEVACLLLGDDLPNPEEFADFRSILAEEAFLPDPVGRCLTELPLHLSVLDYLRAGVSLLGTVDPQLGDPLPEAGLAQSVRLLARFPLLLGHWVRARGRTAAPAVGADGEYAGTVLTPVLGREPGPLEEEAMETALILLADYAFTPSSFAARLVASAGGNLFGAVAAALGAVDAQAEQRTADEIERTLRGVERLGEADLWVRRQLEATGTIAGFITSREMDCDPRAAILERYCAQLAEACGRTEQEDVADAIERATWDEARMVPRIDWPLARLLGYLGAPLDVRAGVAVCGGLVGWCAHALEQAETEELIRPRSRYRGVPWRPFVPLSGRG